MKIFFVIFFFAISMLSFGQNNAQEKYLVGYGQVWGFLKYFHPSTGKQDWDSVLLGDYSKVSACTSDQVFNQIVSNLINKCGNYQPQKRQIADSLKFSESFDWLAICPIDSVNKRAISNLILNKPKFENTYITQGGAGNPIITNEIDYGSYKPSPAIQFLAITRYWNIINYFSPNRNIIPRDWNLVYESNIHNFISAGTYEEYYFAVCKLTTEIRDGHGFIRAEKNPMDAYKYTPFFCMGFSDGYYINGVFQDSLNSIDLKKMDRIVSVNGESVEDKIQQIGTFHSSSNDYYLSKSTYYLRITDRDSITLTVEREGERLTNTYATIEKENLMSRYRPSKSIANQRPYGFFTDSVSRQAYCFIDMGKLKKSDINTKLKRTIRSVDHLIIDNRNYPNSTIIKLSKLLIKEKTKFAKFIKMDFDYPGSFKWVESQTIGGKHRYEGNIYVLVDYNTMSHAEYTVMAFQQHPNTIVIGGQTAGADGNISEIPLPFGIKSVFSGLGVFYPDGTPTQQVGVRRDYEVVQSSSYLQGQDLIMNKALELIRNK